MASIKDLYDAAAEIETEVFYLQESAAALGLWQDCVDNEMPCGKDSDDRGLQLCFAIRYPNYHTMLRILTRDLAAHIEELDEIKDALYEQHKADKAKEKENHD